MFQLVDSISVVDFERLYQCPWSTQSVLQSLPAATRQYASPGLIVAGLTRNRLVVQLLAMRDPLAEEVVHKLFADTKAAQTQAAQSLRLEAITTLPDTPWEVIPLEAGVNPDDVLATVESTATSRWYSILRYMVGVPGDAPARSVVQLLLNMGLITEFQSGRQTIRKATLKGCQFLLADVNAQLCMFVKEYTSTAAARGGNATELLVLYASLGFCRSGDGYSTANLTPVQQSLVPELCALGLLYQHPSFKDRIYPSSLGIALTQASHAAGVGSKKSRDRLVEPTLGTNIGVSKAGGSTRGRAGKRAAQPLAALPEQMQLKVVVENNFRFYAYTTEVVHLRILRIFAADLAQLPNMVVCALTRASVTQAYEQGLRSDDIITYLRRHAHAECLKRRVNIPDNVSEQLVLWERELLRVQSEPGVMFERFMLPEFHSRTLQKARELEALLYHDDRMVLVKQSAAQPMKQFIRSLRKAYDARTSDEGW